MASKTTDCAPASGLIWSAIACATLIAAIALPIRASAQSVTDDPASIPTEEEEQPDVTTFVIDVTVEGDGGGASFASAVAEQSLIGNDVIDLDGDRQATFANAGNYHTGLFAVNQDAGLLNNQGNVVAIALADTGEASNLATAIALVDARQRLEDNTLAQAGGDRTNTISNSFRYGTGIAQINQSSGALNQQLNIAVIALGAAVGAGAAVVLDGELNGTEADNTNTIVPSDNPGARSNSITGSFTGFSGIAQASQVSGDMNRVTQTVAIGVVGGGL